MNNEKFFYLIVADPNEFVNLQNHNFELIKKEYSKAKEYYFFRKNNITLVCVHSRIGLVNSALTTQDLINKYSPEIIFNFGAVGSVIKDDLFKVYQIEKASFWDVATPWYPIGQTPGEKRFFDLTTFENSLQKAHIFSGSSFVSDLSTLKILDENIKYWLFDMELAAMAQVCFYNKVKLVSIKAVSDVIQNQGSKIEIDDINKRINKASNLALESLFEILGKM